MAVFLINNCKFPGCQLTFRTLSDLIQHIEDTHLETDPKSLEIQEEDKPSSLPLSYILRYSSFTEKNDPLDIQKKQRIRAHSPAVSLPESTPTESEVDDESLKSDNDDSDDSWTLQEEFPSDVILNMMGGRERDSEGDRPYVCPVPGCKKRYKNVNGIKYHARHGHKNEAAKVKKSYRCFCGKSYRSAQGLRNHTSHQHPSTDLSSPMTPTMSFAPGVLSAQVSLTSSPSLGTKESASLSDPFLLRTTSLPVSTRVATFTPAKVIPHKISAQVKAVAMAAAKGQGHVPAALALPIGTPVQFISQPASVVPVPVTVKSVKSEK